MKRLFNKTVNAFRSFLIVFNIFIIGLQVSAFNVDQICLLDTLNDIDIARAIIGHKVADLDKIADSLNISMDYDGNNSIYVTYDGTTKEFRFLTLHVHTRIAEAKVEQHTGIGDIFIRYTNSEYKHFTHFRAAEVPSDDTVLKYEKSQGRKWSHIKIEYK